MVTIKSKEKNYAINVPETITKGTKEVISNYLTNIHLPKNYCVIALCYKTRIFDFITMLKSSKDSTINVCPILAKISDEDANKINAEVGRKVIISRSSLERAVHLNVKCAISVSSVRDYFIDSPSYVKELMTDKSNDNIAKKDIILIEYKIVPITDISATIDDKQIIDPMIDRGASC